MRHVLRVGSLAALLACVSMVSAQAPAADPRGDGAKAPAREARPARRMGEALRGVKALRDLEYARHEDGPVRLDLYLPEEAKGPTPVIIWVHGGGWMMGSKAGCPALPWVKEGFAVASVEYRLTHRAPFPAQIHDCKAAVRFLRAKAKEYNLDPERFGAWGASAGGHLVALLGVTGGNAECEGGALGNSECSSAVQCVCDWFGPTDFLSYPSNQAEVSPMLRKLFGGTVSEKRELATLASPALHVKKPEEGKKTAIPPFLIVQGDRDPLVPDAQSRILAEKLTEAGVECELVIVEGAGHGFQGGQVVTEFVRVRDFFKKRLGVGESKDDAESSPAGVQVPDKAKPG